MYSYVQVSGSSSSSSTMSNLLVVHKTVNDVLSGRGNGVKNYPGNVHFRNLVSACKNDFIKFPKEKKNRISQIIFEEIQCLIPPGRFLKEDQSKVNTWIQLEEKDILTKIGQALREDQPKLKEEQATTLGNNIMRDDEVNQYCKLLKAKLEIITRERNFFNLKQLEKMQGVRSGRTKENKKAARMPAAITTKATTLADPLASCGNEYARLAQMTQESKSSIQSTMHITHSTYNPIMQNTQSTIVAAPPYNIPTPISPVKHSAVVDEEEYSCMSLSLDSGFMPSGRTVSSGEEPLDRNPIQSKSRNNTLLRGPNDESSFRTVELKAGIYDNISSNAKMDLVNWALYSDDKSLFRADSGTREPDCDSTITTAEFLAFLYHESCSQSHSSLLKQVSRDEDLPPSPFAQNVCRDSSIRTVECLTNSYDCSSSKNNTSLLNRALYGEDPKFRPNRNAQMFAAGAAVSSKNVCDNIHTKNGRTKIHFDTDVQRPENDPSIVHFLSNLCDDLSSKDRMNILNQALYGGNEPNILNDAHSRRLEHHASSRSFMNDIEQTLSEMSISLRDDSYRSMMSIDESLTVGTQWSKSTGK